MSIGHRIRTVRKEKRLTLEQVSLKAGMKASNLSDIEKGKRDIRTQTLERIALALGCLPVDLLEYEYEKDEEIARGLLDLIEDEKIRRQFRISDSELAWMRTIRFRPDQSPTKKDYIELLFIYRNIG
ncbi:helix-turn-helix domain-containing protein [candidate division KSB1 bacterium]